MGYGGIGGSEAQICPLLSMFCPFWSSVLQYAHLSKLVQKVSGALEEVGGRGSRGRRGEREAVVV